MLLATALPVLVLAALPSPDVLPAGDESPPAVTEGPAEPGTVAGAWSRLDDCRPRAVAATRDTDAAWTRALACGRLARVVARLGDIADRERLWSLYDEAIADVLLQEQILDALPDWHVARALAERESDGPPYVPPADRQDTEVPASLADASTELHDAWRLYDALMQTATGKSAAAARSLPVQQHAATFRRTASDLLRGRIPASAAAGTLGRYEWRGCGSGAGGFYGLKLRALFVAHWQSGQPAPAPQAGLLSLLAVSTATFLPDWRQRMLAASGVDWERFFVGGVLAGETSLAALLAERGSDSAARLLLDVAELQHPSPGERRLVDASDLHAALGAFVASEGPCPGYTRIRADEVERPADAPPVSLEVEKRVLDLLAQGLRPSAGRAEAESASHGLLRLCRTESRDAFAQMRRSPFYELRARGTLGLRALGEAVPDARRDTPVAFRLAVDGRGPCPPRLSR